VLEFQCAGRTDLFVIAVKITGNPNALMQYVNYNEGIVQRYGVELQGWTYEELKNPSELSTAVGPLTKLRDAINDGSCKFVKLSAEERCQRLEVYNGKIASGKIQLRKRKRRSDAGSKKMKSKAVLSEESEESEEEEGSKASKRCRIGMSSGRQSRSSDLESLEPDLD
jgi:hypothetical protein